MAAHTLAKPGKPAVKVATATRGPLTPLAMGRRLAYRHVAFLKLVLPLVALVLLGLVLAWPRLNPDPREFRLGSSPVAVNVEAETSRMLKPRYVGLDESNQPFTVTAETATHAGSADRILLAQPKADVNLKDGSWVALNSKEGLYDRVGQTLGLRGEVAIFHDAGYEFHTPSADIDLANGTASGAEAVQGHGPFGQLNAEGFQILDKGSRILFTGKARVELRPAAGKKGK
jgi:lipopolysaccharide export system protein LptC